MPRISAQRLRSFIPLQGLVDSSLELLARYAKVFSMQRGAKLFEFGDSTPFSYLLLEGELEARSRDDVATLLRADIEQALYPIGNLIPRQFSVKVASEVATLARIDRNILEKELTWGQADSNNVLALCEFSGLPQENHAWMMSLLHSPIFFRLPMSSIQVLFQRFQEMFYDRGEIVVREGDPGDRYFIIRSGTCKVTRRAWGQEVTLGRLHPPQGFGEQALISDQPRAATVVMECTGVLMSLAKKDFVALMQAPLLRRIGLPDAMNMVWSNQGRLIDVRSEVEFTRKHLDEARNIPLYMLYLKSSTFVPARHYIVYCDSGARSEAAAFLLMQKGFNAYVLDGAAEALAEVGH